MLRNLFKRKDDSYEVAGDLVADLDRFADRLKKYNNRLVDIEQRDKTDHSVLRDKILRLRSIILDNPLYNVINWSKRNLK